MTAQSIRLRLDSILQYMAPHWSWVNCHMVNYLTDDHWKAYVPLDLQNEISSPEIIEQCIETVFWNLDEQAANTGNLFPQFTQFFERAQMHTLHAFDDVLLKPRQFEENVLGLTTALKQPIKIKEFFTEKKRHEVEIAASLVNNMLVTSPWHKNSVIVDAGDGKGYVSSRLALEYGHNVLGIDSNTTNTENAMERSEKLKKAWNGLKERAELESKGITPPRRGNWKQKRHLKSVLDEQIVSNAGSETNNYKTVDRFITPEMDLDGLIEENFKSSLLGKPTICLTGLHTCGNLAATCLKLFQSQTSCKLMCNIGCCYHLLKEQFSGPEFFGNKQILDLNQTNGFPLSQYLTEKKVKLGRNARMLAAQSIERTLKAKELPNISLFYRALLELLICEEHPDLKDCVQVGKVRKFNNFVEYVELCRKKYPNLNLKSERIAEAAKLEELQQRKKYLDLFYLLRMTFAPILESLILLDRLLYLKELGHEQSYIIPVFDPVISPRHFAIVALKNYMKSS